MTTPSSVSPSEPAAQRSRWRRPSTWIVLLLLGFGAWLLVSLALTGWHAKKAQTALAAMTSQIAEGDAGAAGASIDTARENTEAARAAVTSMPVAVLNVVPYFGTNLSGADGFMGAARSVLDAADVASDLYPELSGDGGQPFIKNATVDLKAVKRVQPEVAQASQDLTEAKDYLNEVPADVSPFLRGLVQEASPEVERLQKALEISELVLPELPTLLGEDKPATYLVVFHNPAELYAGGGAALNLALLQFDKGKMKVLDRGDVAHFYPLGEIVAWNPVAGGPYYDESGATDGFAWSNLHQDFRIAGQDLMRSWVASGQRPVDGVISLDPAALEAAIAATGPIKSELYGRITADNLVRKLLFEGYNEDPVSQERRHQINQELIDVMLSRMERGDAALTIGRAIFATAPQQHVRIHLSDNRLSEALHLAQSDGAQPDPEPDRIAFFTQNQNSSKIDVFQSRRVVHKVSLEDDGSARVVQRATVTNNAPAKGGLPISKRTGYSTRWAFHWNIVLLPQGADDVKISANSGQIRTDKRTYTDVDGRKAVRVGRWIPPGGSSVITTTYTLPPGTFGSQGDLQYRVGVEHQLVIDDVDLTVQVNGPSQPTPLEGEWAVEGDRATLRFPVTGPTTLALAFGDR